MNDSKETQLTMSVTVCELIRHRRDWRQRLKGCEGCITRVGTEAGRRHASVDGRERLIGWLVHRTEVRRVDDLGAGTWTEDLR